jgi:hypothetical protein
MSYTKRLTESDVKFGFIYIGSEFVNEIPRGRFTLVVGEDSYTVQLDNYGRLRGLGKDFFENYGLRKGDPIHFVKVGDDKIRLDLESARMREATPKPYIGTSRVAAILNVASFHKRRNPHVVTLYMDEPFWGLKDRDRWLWDKLESSSRVLIYGEYRGVRGIYLSGLVKEKKYSKEPVRAWVKGPTDYPCQLYLDLPKIKSEDDLKKVNPITLDELAEMDVPFFKSKPERQRSIIFFDEAIIGKFDELWRIFHERNGTLLTQLRPEAVRDEMRDWLPPRFYEMKGGRLASADFQERINEIFKMLGFEVIEFPSGPYPDAVIHLPEPYKHANPFWIVLDSKNIPGYNLPEDDKRAMVSYINGQRLEALNRGLNPDQCYFLFVAPSFEKVAEEKLRSIESDAKAKGGLLSTETLLYLAYIRLKHGNKARIDKLPDLITGTEITKNKINGILELLTTLEGGC